MVMARTQWNQRAKLPQLDDVFRIMFSAASSPSDPRPSQRSAAAAACPDSFQPLPRRFESFQIAQLPAKVQ
jgi:hypothetical protein